MASLTVNPSTITVTDVNQNNVTVNFSCDKTLTDIKISTNAGSTYKDKISMTQNSATFSISGMSNSNYSCKLKGYYEEEVTEPPTDDYKDILLSSTSFACNKGDILEIPATVTFTEGYPSCELRKNGHFFVSASYNKTEGKFVIYGTNGLEVGTHNDLQIYVMSWVDKQVSPNDYVDIAWSQKFTLTVTGAGDGGGGTNIPVTSVTLDVNSKSLSVGQGFTLLPTIYPSNASNKNVTWSSSNSSVASVNSNGLVTAVANGNCTITVTTQDGYKTATCYVTVSGGGGGETIGGYDTLSLMYPMPQPHGAIPNGAPSDWKYNSRFENKDKPSGWCAFGGWAQVYRVEGSQFSQNTGVELKDYTVYGWKNNQWHQVTKINNPSGTFYVEDFEGDAHSSFPNDIKMSSDYSSTIIRLTSSMMLNGKYVCFHPFTSQMNYDANFEYIYTCVNMRKVKWLDSGVDDRENAKYCASCGGDWWREPGLQWEPDWSNNKGIAQPKIMEVTTDWNKFSMTNVPQSWSNGFPV